MNKDEIIKRGSAVTMDTYPVQPIVIERGEGVYLYDSDGKRYLDFAAGIAVNSLGHAHPGYLAAASSQLAKLNHIPCSYMTEGKMEAAELLVNNSEMDEVFFCNSGTEAVEGALKLARKWAKETKGPDCIEVICFKGSFHGRTFGSMSITKGEQANAAYDPLVPGSRFAEFNNLESVKALVNDKTAAIIVEPIQGEGGIIPATQEFLQGLRELCDQKTVALIFDEIQTGIGRTGKLFACEHYGIWPDIMTLAKGLGNGFPIGVILAKREFSEVFTIGAHGSTFGGNPLATHLAAFVLKEILKPGFLESVKANGKVLLEGLNTLKNTKATVTDVRGIGLIAAIDITLPLKDTLDNCREKGLLPWKSGAKTLRILPPLIINEKEIRGGLAILNQIL